MMMPTLAIEVELHDARMVGDERKVAKPWGAIVAHCADAHVHVPLV